MSDETKAKLIRCADCKRICLDYVPLGEHGLHWRNGKLLNCVNREVKP